MKTLNQDLCLVAIGDRFALIDRQQNRIHLLNAAAAELWRQPEIAVSPAQTAAADACLAWFNANGLLAAASTKSSKSTIPQLIGVPVVFGTTPLEVAANNSAATADPFFEWIP